MIISATLRHSKTLLLGGLSLALPSLATAATGNESPDNAFAAESQVSLLTLVIGASLLAIVIFALHRFARTGMQTWTVGRRLAAGFVSILIVLCGLAFEGYISLHTALVDFTSYQSDATKSNLITEAHISYLEMSDAAKDLIFTQTPEASARYEARERETITRLEETKAAVHTPALQQQIALIEDEIRDHSKRLKELQKEISAEQAAILAKITEEFNAVSAKIDAEVSAIEHDFLDQQTRDGQRMSAEIQHTQSVIIYLGFAAIILGVACSIIIGRSITGPLNLITESLASGAAQTATAAGQVSSASQALAEGASEQAASLEEASASIEEISSMTRRNADSAAEAKSMSGKTLLAANNGESDMETLQVAMSGIKSSSSEIAKVVRTIDEIAFQTNILALNAAVEAARAGEAGAGFAVVAEEVRALAQRSAQAARETGTMIQKAVSNSEQGATLSGKVAATLVNIVQGTRSMERIIAEIAASSDEQSRGITQMSQGMLQMDQVTQINAASAEETAAASEELNAQALSMQDAAEQLRILVGTASSYPKAPHASRSGATDFNVPARRKSAPKAEPVSDATDVNDEADLASFR